MSGLVLLAGLAAVGAAPATATDAVGTGAADTEAPDRAAADTGAADPGAVDAAAEAEAAAPGLRTSTFLGGSEWDEAYDVAVDAAGNSYVAGVTTSPDLPVRDARQPRYGGGTDAFVAKVDRDGRAVWVSYLGGSRLDAAFGIEADAAGNTWVTGRTSSPDFPVEDPLQAEIAGAACQGEPCADAFLTALDPAGGLRWSTYLGGAGNDEGQGVAVAADGSASVAGNTDSTDFPTRNAFRSSPSGIPCSGDLPCPGDVFVSRVAPGGGGLRWSTYLGGSASDLSAGVAVDPRSGAVVATGYTRSADLPARGTLQARIAGRGCGPPPGVPCTDLFVTRLSAEGRHRWTTYFGGTGAETGGSVAVDPDGRIHLAGSTRSTDLPLRRPAQGRLGNAGCDQAAPLVELCDDALAALLSSDGTRLHRSTYLGGAANDAGLGVAARPDGASTLAGSSDSRDVRRVPGDGPAFAGVTDVLHADLAADGTLTRSGYVGGRDAERANAVAVARDGRVHLTGRTGSEAFPLRAPAQPEHAGDIDAFLTRLR